LNVDVEIMWPIREAHLGSLCFDKESGAVERSRFWSGALDPTRTGSEQRILLREIVGLHRLFHAAYCGLDRGLFINLCGNMLPVRARDEKKQNTEAQKVRLLCSEHVYDFVH
jgi:hypothetical protein